MLLALSKGGSPAVRIDGEATLKHVYLHDSFIELRPENPAFNSIILSREDMNNVVIEGKVVGSAGIYKKQEEIIMGFMDTIQKESSSSTASGNSYQYVVLQVTLKEKFIGTGSGNLTELENVINQQAAKGYRLHTITTANGGSKGLMGGDRIQATMVFEKVV